MKEAARKRAMEKKRNRRPAEYEPSARDVAIAKELKRREEEAKKGK